jgi:hypothetical protein
MTIINPFLVLSSISFILPMTIAINKKYYLQYFSLLSLLLTSVLYHATKNNIIFWLDKIILYMTMILFLVDCHYSNHIYLPIILNIYNIYMYFYGYMTEQYVFSNTYWISMLSHASLHIFNAISYSYILHYKLNNDL